MEVIVRNDFGPEILNGYLAMILNPTIINIDVNNCSLSRMYIYTQGSLKDNRMKEKVYKNGIVYKHTFYRFFNTMASTYEEWPNHLVRNGEIVFITEDDIFRRFISPGELGVESYSSYGPNGVIGINYLQPESIDEVYDLTLQLISGVANDYYDRDSDIGKYVDESALDELVRSKKRIR